MLIIQDRAKGSKGTRLHGGWWGHHTEKTYTGRGGHRTFFVDGESIRVGTPQKIERKYVRKPFRHLQETF